MVNKKQVPLEGWIISCPLLYCFIKLWNCEAVDQIRQLLIDVLFPSLSFWMIDSENIQSSKHSVVNDII